ncbi:hypothetical protein BSL78_05520 [Apostichopus japonicus]|uniref:Uncharacterized protein n=1 Tax=Stichopus japonicus TaxID=307972 RepID=A0A2G8LBI9_STIJA|nr:hypothetical protein BSL78_05520 [Apostichopus japonicus]
MAQAIEHNVPTHAVPSSTELDIYCERYSHIHYRDLHRIANQIDSDLEYVSDRVSTVSSQAGIVGSIMMATSFIPTPLSGVLFYYGGYLAAGSTVGHASNTAYKVFKEPIDVRKLKDTFEKVRKFMENAKVVEIFHEGREKLSSGATLLIDSDVYFSGEKTEAILLRLQEIEEFIYLMGNEQVSFNDLVDLYELICKILKYFTGAGFNFETLTIEYHNQKNPTQDDSGTAIQRFSPSSGGRMTSEMMSITSGVVQNVAVGQGLLAGINRWAVVFNGMASVWNIKNELESIKSTEIQTRERQRMADEIRDVAEKIREVCSRSPYCK